MNKSLALLSTALLLATASPAFAASSVDLTVKGLITPNACTPALSNGGVVDHGKIAAKDLVQNNPTNLPRVTLQMTINCDAATPLAIRPIDNRSGTSFTSGFGLGLVNGKKLGGTEVVPQNIIVDGAEAQPILSGDGGNSWYAEKYWDVVGSLWSVAAPGDATTPIPVKDLTMDLEMRTRIARADQFDFSEEVLIDGNGVLELMYL